MNRGALGQTMGAMRREVAHAVRFTRLVHAAAPIANGGRGLCMQRPTPHAPAPRSPAVAAAAAARPGAPRAPQKWRRAHHASRKRQLLGQHLRRARGAAGPEQQKDVLLVFDFDKTITADDAGEELIGHLAPDLVPQLAALQMPANFIPLTNSILSELQDRGIGRDEILAALARMGAGGAIPAGAARMLRAAHARGADVKLLSDCNSVFIPHMLAAAGLLGCVGEVLTNPAAFQAGSCAAAGGGAPGGDAGAGGASERRLGAQRRRAAHRLVISPRFAAPHGCRLCPSNLCKGAEMRQIIGSGRYKRIIYGGDGANDVCPALSLRAGDAVLARAGHALARFAAADAPAAAGGAKGAAGGAAGRIQAEVFIWDDHDELARLVDRLTAAPGDGHVAASSREVAAGKGAGGAADAAAAAAAAAAPEE